MEIYVVDIETTGLDGSPKDHVIEIAIMRINLLTKNIHQIYHELIHYDISTWSEELKEAWIFKQGYIKLEEIMKAEKNLFTVINEVQQILTNKTIAAFNNEFDFEKFLKKEPWNINLEKSKTKIAPCIMVAASEYLLIRSKKRRMRRKIVNLGEAKKNLLNEEAESLLNNKELEEKIKQYSMHRANYDAFYEACILLELYKLGKYKVIPQIYYAHSMLIYRTKQERKELKNIKQSYPKATIINPRKFEKKWKNLPGKKIIGKCLELVSDSDIVVFSGIEEEKKIFIGKGVYVEVMFAFEINKEVYYIADKLENKFSIEIYDDDDWSMRFARVILRN